MAMNKKEQEMVEGLKTRLALRWTEMVKPDVPPPTNSSYGLATGYIPRRSDAVKACSSCVSHGIGSHEQTTSQRPISLYSTRLLALKAVRYQREVEFACALREIDKLIEDEEAQQP